MKIPAFSALVLLAFLAQSPAQAPIGPNSIKGLKIELSAPNTPEYQIDGVKKRSTRGKWLEFEVGFEVVAPVIDELTFKYIVHMTGERRLLTGEVTYANLTKGREKFAVMYISPKAIDRLTGGKALTGSAVANVWVEVSRQGQVLAREGRTPGAIPNLPQEAGYLQNKDQTPFAPLYYDRYETIKPTR